MRKESRGRQKFENHCVKDSINIKDEKLIEPGENLDTTGPSLSRAFQ